VHFDIRLGRTIDGPLQFLKCRLSPRSIKLRFVPISICDNRRLLLRLILISQNLRIFYNHKLVSILQASRVDIFNYFNYHNALQTRCMHRTVHEFVGYDKDRHKSEF